MRDEFKNLLLVLLLYFLVTMIVQQWQEPDEYTTTTQYVNGFFHYILLGYFASRLWSVVLLVTAVYSAKEVITQPTEFKTTILKLVSVKFVGLIVGIVVYWASPVKVDLISAVYDLYLSLKKSV